MSASHISRIAIINPYLDLGSTDFVDMQFLNGFMDSAKKLGIETAIFKRSNEISQFAPDFVISISPQEPKLTQYPTYVLLLKPISFITTSKRFTRNLLTYDGYFSSELATIDLLKELCLALNKPLFFAQELSIENIIKTHQAVVKENGYEHSAENNADKIVYFIHVNENKKINPTLIENIKQQSHHNIQTVLLLDERNVALHNAVKPYLSQTIRTLHYTGVECNFSLLTLLHESHAKWFGILNPDDKLFSNHCKQILKTYQNSQHNKNNESIAIVFGNSLEHSSLSDLTDKIQDQQLLYPTSNVRVGNIMPHAEIPLCAALIKTTSTILSAFSGSDFTTSLRLDFESSAEPLEIAIHSNVITCSTSITKKDNQALFVIHDNINLANTQDKQQQKSTPQRDYQSTIDRTFYDPQKPIVDTKKYAFSVSIVLRTKDRPICLPRAIKSIVNQTFKDWQLVIVNDGGKLETVSACLQSFSQELKDRVVVINNATSLGMSRGMNMAIDASSSEFIVAHDDDDTWHPEFLQQTVSFLRNPINNDCCAVITHSTRVVEEIVNGALVERARTDFNSKENPFARVSLYRLLMQNNITTNAYLFRRNIIDKIGYFNEDLPVLNDWDFNIRCALHHEIGVIPQFLANYHHRMNQQDSAYGNSIIHTSSLCLQYETVIRNRGLRNVINSKNHSELFGLFFALGGHELPSLHVPGNINQIGNFLQQLPQFFESKMKETVTTEVNTLKTQLSVLQMKLDKLLVTTAQ